MEYNAEIYANFEIFLGPISCIALVTLLFSVLFPFRFAIFSILDEFPNWTVDTFNKLLVWFLIIAFRIKK